MFDLDGTLFCETDPNYFDYTLLKYRVLEDPGYIDRASDFEKETAQTNLWLHPIRAKQTDLTMYIMTMTSLCSAAIF